MVKEGRTVGDEVAEYVEHADVKPPKCLSLCEALGADDSEDVRRSSNITLGSTGTGASEASLSEAASSQGGGSPRLEFESCRHFSGKHGTVPARPGLLQMGCIGNKAWADVSAESPSPDSSPKRSRRRRQRTGAMQAEHRIRKVLHEHSPVSTSPGRTRMRKPQDASLAASESPCRTHGRHEYTTEQGFPMAASSSPVRSRAGTTRGIMGTTVVNNMDAPLRAFPIFEAPAGYSQRMSTPVTSMMLGSSSLGGSANTSATRLGIMSTRPYVPPSSNAGLVLVTAPPTMPPTAPRTLQPTSYTADAETDVNMMLKSVLGSDNLPTGEDLDALLRSAEPEVYSD